MTQHATVQPAPPAPGLTTQERMRALFAHVAETCDLPVLPTVAIHAMTLARNPNATVEALARVVGTDVALAARVLKISRSVGYLRRHPPRTLGEAIVTVGFKGLRKILIVASARSVYRSDDAVAQRLWEHALATALAADELAALACEPRGAGSFLAGLFHDIGKLVFHLADPAAFTRLAPLDETRDRELYGVTHAAVGGCLAERWGLEDDVVEAITFHHAGPASPLAARVALADRIAHHIGCGSVPAGAGPEGSDDETIDRVMAGRVAKAFAVECALFD